jgi:antirestriction protein ArdC
MIIYIYINQKEGLKMGNKITTHEILTNRVIELMEKHGSNWSRPWSCKNEDGTFSSGRPYSVASGANYRGINLISLAWSPFSSNAWNTFKNWKLIGGIINKESFKNGYPIFYYSTGEKVNVKTGKKEKYFFHKYSTVFNVEQLTNATEMKEKIENMERLQDKISVVTEIARNKAVDSYIASTGAVVKHGGNRAYYSPSLDYIQLPHITDFKGLEDYYSTAMHELTHWTGNKKRLDRIESVQFGSDEYAFEELVAELGATFLCNELMIENEIREDHAKYLNAWLKILKNDSKAISRASGKASKAVEYLNEIASKELVAVA